MAKRRDHGYYPRRHHWTTIQARISLDAIVGGVLGSLTPFPLAEVSGLTGLGCHSGPVGRNQR
jgi:hypothetical protein